MSSPLNKSKFQQFVRQAKGAQVFEIHVNRADKGKNAVLHYNGRASKGKNRLTAQWTIPRADRDEADVTKDIQAFLELARKTFYVHRGEGLEDEAYADEAMEAKGKPITSESSDG
jgi:hypothetical protein